MYALPCVTVIIIIIIIIIIKSETDRRIIGVPGSFEELSEEWVNPGVDGHLLSQGVGRSELHRTAGVIQCLGERHL